ncbi:MAG: hypothetical protein JWN62_2565 [Acidimicrobiales bacterium]|nr:hypothetical protein [Acidimicrobiales bacterium]
MDATHDFHTNARVTRRGVMLPREGVLVLDSGRLRFTTLRGEPVFDVAAADAWPLTTSWYMMGTGFAFKAEGRKRHVSFNKLRTNGLGGRFARPGSIYAAVADIRNMRTARAMCALWKRALAASSESTE